MIGLLGHNISYTYSPDIHKRLGYDYQVFDLDENQLKDFMRQRKFQAINVTIPYKAEVIQYCDEVDEVALRLNAVNTIVNKEGKLYGYNTDVLGMKFALTYNNVEIRGKKVLILGTGSTSESVMESLQSFNPKTILKIGRKTDVNYDNLEAVKDFEIIINTTPRGVYPNIYDSPLDLDVFDHLEAVVDVVYNPLNTQLIRTAKDKGIKAFGGLMMLVAQAVYSSEYFFDHKLAASTIVDIYLDLKKEKRNIVLIGMPTAGKTTLAKALGEALNKPVFDVDTLIVEEEKQSIPEIFALKGEAYFRNKEAEIIKKISKEHSAIIATGGGSILDYTNVNALKMNGKLVFIDRQPELLKALADRPLSADKDKLLKLYEQRIDRYRLYADAIVENNTSIKEACEKLLEVYHEDTHY